MPRWTLALLACTALPLLAGCQTAPKLRPVLPGVAVDVDRQIVAIDGAVCLDQGFLEYIAVAEGGKTYESLFALDCRPAQLHTALLISGYTPGNVHPEVRGVFAPDGGELPPDGAPARVVPPEDYEARATDPTRVHLHVDVQQDDGSWLRCPIEQFLIARATEEAPRQLTWAFTGSFFAEDPNRPGEFYVADVERSLIALWYDSAALFNLTKDLGSPYRGESLGIELNPETLPPLDTPIRLIIQPAG